MPIALTIVCAQSRNTSVMSSSCHKDDVDGLENAGKLEEKKQNCSVDVVNVAVMRAMCV